MKVLPVLLILLFAASAVTAQETLATEPTTQAIESGAPDDATNPRTATWNVAMPNGLAGLLGYKSVPVKQSFSHDTNPGDSFLPNANLSGSAGRTALNRAQYIDAGFRYELPISNNWSFNVDATGLFAVTTGNGADASGMNLDDSKNANDSRPAAGAAFVYTDSKFGFDLAVGTTYSLTKDYYVGVQADLTSVFVDNGWDRFSSYEVQSSKLLLVPAAGLKLGWRVSKDAAIEGSVLYGKNGLGYSAGLVFHF